MWVAGVVPPVEQIPVEDQNLALAKLTVHDDHVDSREAHSRGEVRHD
jgi:hypothetical protein